MPALRPCNIEVACMRPEVQQAVELVQSGSPGGLDTAVGLLKQTVFSFSMKVCGHREDAEDTMQDVLTKAFQHLPRFDHPQALSVWLYTVAKNQCLMSRRQSKFAPKETLSLNELLPDGRELEELLESGSPTPEAVVLNDESSERVLAAVHQVPPQYRLILVLHDMEELSTAEVARIMGLREGTVRVRLHRARLFVRKELARAGKQATRSHSAAHPAPHTRSRDCKQIFAALSDYVDGALDEAMCERIRRHMGDCKACEAFLNSLRGTVKQLHAAQPAVSQN